MRTGSCAGCGHRKKLYGDRCVGCLSTGAHGDARPGRQPPPWTDVGGGRVNARPSNPMREAQEHEAFDRHLASLPKLLCGCSVGTGCDGAHARRPAKHGDSAKLSVADAHQLRILKDTVRNPLKGQFLGGPSAEEAEETLRSKFRFTSEQIRNLKGGARHGETSSRGGEERHDYEHRGAPFVVGTDTRGDRTRWLYWIKGMAGAGPYFSTRGAAVTGAKKRIDAALDKEWPGIFRPDVGWLSRAALPTPPTLQDARRGKRSAYVPPVRYTDQQLAWFDIADLVSDLESVHRQHPNDPAWLDYIADVERQIAKKSAAFRAAYGVDFSDWSGHAPGLPGASR